jgi:hypothetical protein
MLIKDLNVSKAKELKTTTYLLIILPLYMEKSIAHLRDNKPLKYAQISLCVMDLPQGLDLYQEKYRTVKPP